jgi:hypothetical protein
MRLGETPTPQIYSSRLSQGTPTTMRCPVLLELFIGSLLLSSLAVIA